MPRHRLRTPAVLVVLATLGVAALAACGDDTDVVAGSPAGAPSDPSTTPPTGTVAPPADETEGMYLSQRRFGTQGGTLAFSVHNDGGAEQMYGVSGSIERWNGERWETHRLFGSALRFWHSLGTTVVPGEELAVPDIGLIASPGAFGPVEWLTIPPLEPGWYRLARSTNADLPVSGRFEVVDDAVDQIDFGAADAPALDLNPAVVTAGTTTFAVNVTHPSIGTLEALIAYHAGLARGGTVERWDGTTWTVAGNATFDTGPAELGGFDETVTVPADLTPGVYRITRSHTDGTTLTGELFVAAGPPAG
jgi:hypothetical protein